MAESTTTENTVNKDIGRLFNLDEAKKQTRILDGIKDALVNISTGSTNLDSLVVAMIDGTANGFKRAMKLYMQLHKITKDTSSADLTTAVTGFYQLLQDNFSWNGYTKFYDSDIASLSTGEKLGDNAGLSCTPSSAEAKGQDDYEGLPLFACIDCNWTFPDDAIMPQITAIDGVVGNFKRYDPTVFVGVLQMSGYHYYSNPHENSNQYYYDGFKIGDSKVYTHCEPLPESVNTDSTIRPWVVHGKYAAGLNGNLFTCCSGVVEACDQSHNSSQTHAHAVGTNYSGMCACDLGFLQIMTRIKYASLTLDGILDFCKSYNAQSIAKVAESGVKRVIIAASDKSKYLVGSNIQIGNGASTDRNTATTYNISGKSGYTITDVTDVTIDGTQYAAVYVDTDTTFDTAAGDSDNANNTQITTMLWKTGTTDDIEGNDGAIDPTSNKYPVKLQGIEFGLGACEVLSDTIFKLYQDDTDSNYYCEPYTVKLAKNQTTSITANYASAGVKFNQSMTEGWIKASMWGKDGVLLPVETGGSSSTYMRDYIWHNKDTKDTTREVLAFGNLGYGGDAGLSCLDCNYTLGFAWWNRAGRLSPNGVRG